MNLYHSIGSIIQRYCMLSSAQGNVKTVLLLPWLQSVEVCLRSDHSLSPLWRDHDICVQANVHDPVSSIPGPWTLSWDPGLSSPRLPLLPAGQTRISGDVLKDILNYSLNWNIFNYFFNCNIFCQFWAVSISDQLRLRVGQHEEHRPEGMVWKPLRLKHFRLRSVRSPGLSLSNPQA